MPTDTNAMNFTQSPLITVIVPARNVSAYVEKCLRSILDQTYSNIEVIAVDDGSTDDTGQILDRLASADQRLRIIHNEQCAGLYEARRIGYRACVGSLVAFVDSDDLISPTMYESMLKGMIASQSDIVICGVDSMTEAGRYAGARLRFGRTKVFEGDLLKRYCNLEFGSGWAWNKLYKRELIEYAMSSGFDPSIKLGEDYPFNIYTFHRASRVLVLPARHYKYLIRSGGLSNSSTAAFAFLETLSAYVHMLEQFNAGSEEDLKSIDVLYSTLIRHYSHKIKAWDEAQRARLSQVLTRIAVTRPEAFHALINYRGRRSFSVRVRSWLERNVFSRFWALRRI